MIGINIKCILYVLLLFGFMRIGISIDNYDILVGPTSEFSLLAYYIGLVIGLSIMLAATSLDVRDTRPTSPATLKKSGIVVIVALLITLVAVATGVAYYLDKYMPEKTGFAGAAYVAGIVIGFISVCIIYYLPNYLPHEEKPDEK